MTRQTLYRERWKNRAVSAEAFRDMDLTDCSFHHMRFSRCTFSNCRFKNCYIGFSCRYEQCIFDHCSFTGKYSAFGGDCRFDRCSIDATTIRSATMEGVTFAECRASGRWQSLLFYGPGTPAKPTVFAHVDLSAVQLINVDFRCGVDLSSVSLPKVGVRILRNPTGIFTRRLREVALSLDKESGIALGALGHEMYDSQNPVVICDDVLNDLLTPPAARAAFEDVARACAA